MIEIQNYVRAEKSSAIIGGMLWLKMEKKRVATAIDLSGLGLDTIEETPEEYRIGAMVTLRQIETHTGLNALTDGAAHESVRHIVGVQFRNLATVGGRIFWCVFSCQRRRDIWFTSRSGTRRRIFRC